MEPAQSIARARRLPEGDLDIGASLAEAARSVDRVAEAWLEAAARLLPGCWMGIYRCDEGRPWVPVCTLGEAPSAPPRMQEPCSAEIFQASVMWLRLREHPGPAFFFGVAVPQRDDPAWLAAQARMKPWLPVAALALDHALLRAAPAERLDVALARTEKRLIERVLAEHHGQITASARALGLTRQGLYKKLKRLEIDTAPYKSSGDGV